MSQRTTTAMVTPIALLILAIAIMIPMPAAAQSPVDIADSDGILGDPPTIITSFFIPLLQASDDGMRECPLQIGEGYVCTGSDALDTAEASPVPSAMQDDDSDGLTPQ